MTNKTINGVIEQCALHLEWYGDPAAIDRANELRALLAAPDPIVEADGIGEPVAYRYKEGHASWENEKPWEPTTLKHGAVLLERKALSEAGAFKGDSQAYYLALAVEPLYSADQLAALQSTIAQLKAENERLNDQLCVCPSCHGQGEVFAGSHSYQGHFQPPEPDMDKCSECGGDGVIGTPADLAAALAENERLRGGLKLPAKKSEHYSEEDCDDEYPEQAKGWNACLDEVRRMNDLPKSSK